jgi:hypothetical protein
MKSKIVTPIELYNTIKVGQIFWGLHDDMRSILDPCVQIVLFVERRQTNIHVFITTTSYEIYNDTWFEEETQALNDHKIRLIYD